MMPRLPTIKPIQQRTSAEGPLGPGPTGDRSVVELGQALRGVASTLQAQKVREIQTSYEVADATARSLSELQAFRESLASNENYDQHGQLFLDHARELEAQYKDAFSSPLAFKVWQNDFRQAAAQQEIGVAVDAEKLKVAKVRTDLGDTLFQLSNLVGVNEEQDRIVRARAHTAIVQNAEAGNLDYSERDALIRKFDEDAAEASIRRDMIRDPAMAERKLAAGAYPQMSGEKAAIWAQRVSAAAETEERRKLAAEDHAEKVAERHRKQAGEAAAKYLDALPADELTPDKIEQYHDVLPEADYRHYYDKMRNPPGHESGPADPEGYADLRYRAGNGEDVRDEARAKYLAGGFRLQDFNAIMSEVESERPGWRARGTRYISDALAYSDINPTPGAPQAKAEALIEWAQWADDHPKATTEEATKAFHEISKSHQLAQEAGLNLTLAWPTYGVGDRNKFDLVLSTRRTIDAHDNGELDDDEFGRQMLILQQWKRLINGPILGPTSKAVKKLRQDALNK